MNSSSEQLSATQITREASKLIHTNKKIFILIVFSVVIILPLLSQASFFSINSLTKNVTAEILSLLSKDPKTPEYQNLLVKIKEDAIVFIVVLIVLQLFAGVISLCSMVAIIYTSAMSYIGKEITLGDIYWKLKKIWLRPVITCFCSSLVRGGYFLVILPLFLVQAAEIDIIIVVVGIVLILVAFAINLYLSSILTLGIVSSVLEDSCGLQALGEGQKLLEGRKRVGCYFSLLFPIVASPVYLVFVLNKNRYQTTYQWLGTYFGMTIHVLVSTVSPIVFTVLYFDCKKWNGEEVDIQGEADMGEYRIVAAAPMDGSNFA